MRRLIPSNGSKTAALEGKTPRKRGGERRWLRVFAATALVATAFAAIPLGVAASLSSASLARFFPAPTLGLAAANAAEDTAANAAANAAKSAAEDTAKDTAKITAATNTAATNTAAKIAAATNAAAESPPSEGGAARKALQPLQGLVGEWRGAGQIRRGSPDGGWTEESAWVWRFEGAKASLHFTVARGKYFVSGSIQPGTTPKSVELIAKTASGREVKYAGEIAEGGSVTATTADPKAPADAPQRVSLRVIANGDRLVMLLERRSAISDRFARVAEIGYTRRGSEFGKGAAQPECVVTGGLGTIQVSYKGQMYYVCCAGCRDLFEQKPDEILTEYRERKQAEAAKKKAR
jgi:hypothetical protein